MGSPRRGADDRPDREAWSLLADMVFSKESQARFAEACAAANVSPPQLKALMSLQPDTAEPMRALARDWGCDASWVTGIIDGLEERGYVERRTLPTDRRVKVVQMTGTGEAAKARALERLHEPPPSFSALDHDDQVALRDLLRKMSDGMAPEALAVTNVRAADTTTRSSRPRRR